MEDLRKEQKEALEVLVEFNGRLVKNLGILKKELSGQRLEDTDKFIKGIVDAINWEVQVMNGTMELLNEGKERINKAEYNEKLTEFSSAIASKSDAQMAECVKAIIPLFENLGVAAKEVISYE